ncbi:MAG: Trm112 family protein [Planctomycetes bacterium]|nr:Trm112 family protein [Planctomycetota bacterium]
MAIRPEVLELLVCPVPECRARLELRDDRLVCTACGRRYRIEQSWPVLIPEEAELPEAAQNQS